MNERTCDVCNGINTGDNLVIQLTDDKERILVNGHENCINDLHKKITSLKDLEKKTVQRILKEVKFMLRG